MRTARIELGSAWHSGEVALQKIVGSSERLRAIGSRVVRDFMPDQHRNFFAQLPFALLGVVDSAGAPWATIASGTPGFMASQNPKSLTVGWRADPSDPAAVGLAEGNAIGLLGIELSTQRRNRMNGTVAAVGDDGLTLAVDQSFGNCPQYIRLRDYHTTESGHRCAGDVTQLDALEGAARRLVEVADTFFVATYADLDDGRRQVDASHRGGDAGFVHVGDDGRLTIPDYSGNQFFNTLGNILANGRAGLLFIDFASGDVLQLSGVAEVLLDDPIVANFKGAERLWRVMPTRGVMRRRAVALSWTDRR